MVQTRREHSRDYTLRDPVPINGRRPPIFGYDDLPFGKRIIGTTVEMRFLGLCSIHQLFEKIAVRIEVNAATVRRVLGVEQAISIVMFLLNRLVRRLMAPHSTNRDEDKILCASFIN